MSNLTDTEKRYFENLLEMGGGYVLDFSDKTYGEFFRQFNINIHGAKYQDYGTSKAKKLRSFWEIEDDKLVGKILDELLNSYEASCLLREEKTKDTLLQKCREITQKLVGKSSSKAPTESPNEFLNAEFSIPDIDKLPIKSTLVPIIQARLDEARTALSAQAYLSVIFLYGSVLEAVLLGKATRNPKIFNMSPTAPKNNQGKVKAFHEWSLAQLIDTSTQIKILKPDVKKFSHGLRDFRNYIHPYEQLQSGFQPDEHTAKLCFQALKAALASVAGKR